MFARWTVFFVCLALFMTDTEAAATATCSATSADLCLAKYVMTVFTGPLQTFATYSDTLPTADTTLDTCIASANCATDYETKVTNQKNLGVMMKTMVSASATATCSLAAQLTTCLDPVWKAASYVPSTTLSDVPTVLDEMRKTVLSGGAVCTTTLDYTKMATCLTTSITTLTTSCITPKIDAATQSFSSADVVALVSSIFLNFNDATTMQTMIEDSCQSGCAKYADRLTDINTASKALYTSLLGVTPTSNDGSQYCTPLKDWVTSSGKLAVNCNALAYPTNINPQIITSAKACGIEFAGAESVYLHGASMVFALVSALFFLINRGI